MRACRHPHLLAVAALAVAACAGAPPRAPNHLDDHPALAGDGDPLDVLLLGPRVERGALVAARPVGVLRLADDGERDDKILAVPTSGPFSDVATLDELDARYPGALAIVETWFTHYKGPGRVASAGFEDEHDAWASVDEASRAYEAGGD